MAIEVGEIDEEPAAGGEVRRERKTQQSALAAGGDRAAQVEQILRERAVADHPDAAGLLHRIEHRAIGRVGHEGDRGLQAGHEGEHVDRRPATATPP